MGVGNSLQSNARNYEPPPLPPPFYTAGGYLTGTPRVSTAEEIPQNVQTEESRIRSSLRNEELWHQRPSAPSLSSLRQPRETLLTYAAQMTGWQSEYTPSAPSVHQESMELTRTVSHLAAANQQLATAHNAVLAQLERVYMELIKEREAKILSQNSQYRSSDDNDLIRRIEELENLIAGRVNNEEKKHDKCFLQTRRHLEEQKNYDSSRRHHEALERIQILENELEPPGHGDTQFSELDKVKNENRIPYLLNEISRLTADQLNTQEVNKKLVSELEKHKKLMERLRRDYETSRNNCEMVESSLTEREEELERLKKDFDVAKSETLKVTKELDAFHVEKDTTTARIKDLERDLQKAEHARNETITLAGEESGWLKNCLQEELKNKRKQHETIEESLREIQRLNEIIDGMKKETKCHEKALDAEPPTESDGSAERPSLEEFKKDLSMKREARQRAIAAVSSEMDRLRRELDAEKEAHSETSRILDLLKSQSENIASKSETFSVGTTTCNTDNWCQNEWSEQNPVHRDVQRLTDVLKVSDELRACIRVQIEKIDDLRYHLECDPEINAHRIEKLKEIANSTRNTFSIREEQINSLKNILSITIARLGDDKYRIDVAHDLRTEHDRQLDDIRKLKNLYDERIRILVELKDTCLKELANVNDKLKSISKEKELLNEDYEKAEEKIDAQQTDIANLESQLGLTKADCRDLQNQMNLINGLFSQMLLSASSSDMDLDRLTQLLQENHDLISEMAREEGTEAAALPKLLLDLVEQVEGRERTKLEDDSEKKEDQQEENIANNLPKVWRVLLELLSCHAACGSTSTSSNLLSADPNVCYKSVDTPAGPRLVISVSKTYIRLKELILEKKHLEKEMGRLKQLNSHLESKLGEQEKRLSTISDELSKTWSIVGRMQTQHQQLHTHEKILRYELQQKRKMLQELKQELEYCREKWESARQKNTNTEMEWKNLRREFAARKALAVDVDSFNNSAESGFSDERGDDTDDDDIPNEERLRISPRRRTRKESPRTPTPDTESDHPTDNESSDLKTVSTVSNESSEQRTLSPDKTTNNKLIIVEEDITDQQVADDFDPLDRALAKVIQNLINADGSNINDINDNDNDDNNNEQTHVNLDADERINGAHNGNNSNSEQSEESKVISVFSIGPSSISSSVISTNDESNNSLENTTMIFGQSATESKNDLEEINEENCTEVTTDQPAVLSENNCSDDKKEINNQEPSTSTSSTSSQLTKPTRSPEEVLAARAARLKRLEEQADWLMKKMNATSQRGTALNTRLEELHEAYGEVPTPPPLPDVLPAIRLPTNLKPDDP